MGTHRRTATIALALAIGVPAACKRQLPRPSGATSTTGPLVVEFAGCGSVRRGPLCVLSQAHTLSLWVSSQAVAPLELLADGQGLSPSAVADTPSGKRYALTLPASCRRIALKDGAGRRWDLRLRAARRPNAAVRRARTLRQEGRAEQAEATLRAALPLLDAEDRIDATALLGRIALARGASAAAAATLERNRLQAAELGLLSQSVDDATTLSFLLTVNLRAFARARRVLAQARALAERWPTGRARLPYYEGLIAWESGDLRSALRAFRDAATRSSRLGLKRLLRYAEQQIALTLASLGRNSEALRIQRELLVREDEEPPCSRADLHTNLAWIASLARPETPITASERDPVARQLRRAWQLLERCPDPFRRRNALINETLWAVQRRELKIARQHATELRALKGGHNAQHAIWQEEALGRTALATGEPRRALQHFERQSKLAAAVGHEEGRFRAWSGIGQAREQLGQLERAARGYRQAEQILTRWLEWVPFSEGRDAFLGNRDRNARYLVDLLVRLGDASGAATAARLARARLLRAATRPEQLAQLPPASRQQWERAVGRYRRLRRELETEATNDWALPADALSAARARRRDRLREARAALDDAFYALHGDKRSHVLRPPAANELQLIYFPGRQGWIGIAVLQGGATAKRLGHVDLKRGERLLQPFAPQIAQARQITVFPYGALRGIDFHALAWRDGRLLDHALVTYAADTDVRAQWGPEQATVLIVGDPEGDLPHAREEAERVATALKSHSPITLIGPDATRSATLRALPNARLFHYAGHATFGGTEGADSALLLHDGQRLSLGDILALPHAPQTVVLSACESAQTSAKETIGTGLGLAHAFVAAGSRLVIAPVRPVADGLARALTSAVFTNAPIEPWQIAMALRNAQLHLARTNPDADWASFRVLRP